MKAPQTGIDEKRTGTAGGAFCRGLGTAGVALFVMTAFTPVPNVLGRWSGALSQLEPAEAIVVLGGGVRSDGGLSDGSMRRMLHGILLHRRGLASLLVFFGPGRGEAVAEADLRAAFAGELGMPPDAILTVTDAQTTQEEATRGRALLRARGVRRILLVTEVLHMARARAAFEREGFEVLAAPTDELSSGVTHPQGRLRLMRRLLEECIGRLYYRLAGYV